MFAADALVTEDLPLLQGFAHLTRFALAAVAVVVAHPVAQYAAQLE